MANPQITMTVGAPGSGKTTYARSLDPTEWVIISLDDIRASLFGSKQVYWKHVGENPWMRDLIHTVQRGMLRSALKLEKNVVLANTHTNPESCHDVIDILVTHRIEPKIVVFDVPWETLVAREQVRTAEDAVGQTFLRQSYEQQWAPNAWWRSMPNVEFNHQAETRA
jgi:predicted kinase